ncbi:uncharacterized protein LOC132197337 [Neocloeon triangulifer]|uniref:uncharacterized protein LOC132197337 n=1 Tax=Neocloeon triangulifer TaxID=2078957 RepID=UPI00286F2B53|nr:uncharacterized protein LOC132197337 [Neocloeon triangulifer]
MKVCLQLLFSIIIINSALEYSDVDAAGIRTRSPHTLSRNSKRLRIIKCCGQRTCTDPFNKNKQTHANATTSFKTPSYKPSKEASTENENMTSTINVNSEVETTESSGETEPSLSSANLSESTTQGVSVTDSTLPISTLQNNANNQISQSMSSTSDSSTSQPSSTTSTEAISTMSTTIPSSITSTAIAVSTITTASTTKTSTVLSTLTTASSISTPTTTQTTASSTSTPKTTASSTSTPKTTASSTSTPSTTTLSTSTTTTASSTTTITTTTTTQVPEIYPTCQTNVQSNQSFFNSDGTLNDPDIYGIWIQSCQQQFLLGKSLVSWNENFIKCGQIGMDPLVFESQSKLDCFAASLNSFNITKTYWTSAFKMNSSQVSWCSKNGTTGVEKSILLPNIIDEQKCLQFNATSSQFFNKMCNDSSYFACQGPTTPAPACSAPVCPNITCAKNQSLFTSDPKGQYLSKPLLHGTWYAYQGRKFLFSFNGITKTFEDAIQACCELGMNLLSLEYDYKYKSLIASAKATGTNDNFWTSGSDMGCEGTYGYCTAKRLLRKEAVWMPGQPDNSGKNQNALAAYVNATHVLLSDYDETTELRYICEARDSSNASTGGTAIRSECAMAYNVSQAEIDGLLNLASIDLRIKCFMKCLGENSGLFVNGKFVDSQVLDILEKMSSGNLAELKKNMDYKDECEQSTTGMDECDKAAQMIQCTKDKAPDVLNSVISAVDNQTPIEKVQLPPPALCPDIPEGVVNETLKAAFDNAPWNTTIPGGYVGACCWRRYLFSDFQMYPSEGYKFCNSYGLKLAWLENAGEINCIWSTCTTTHPDAVKWTWVALTRNGSLDNPRWCTSSIPFSVSGYASVVDNDVSYTGYVYKGSTMELMTWQETRIEYVLCK